MSISKLLSRLSRKRRIRAKVCGTAICPRLSIFRSLNVLTAQLIDDDAGHTIASASTKEIKTKSTIEGAKKLGTLIAKKAKEVKIEKVVFDRGGYKYHGRVKAIAEAAREGGLIF